MNPNVKFIRVRSDDKDECATNNIESFARDYRLSKDENSDKYRYYIETNNGIISRFEITL